MRIREAKPEELDEIMNIYAGAKVFMAANGNPGQWNGTYPERELLLEDIRQHQLYVYEDARGIGAVFVYFIGTEPTYQEITDGAWLNDRPYGTLHRIAVARFGEGIASECMKWCLAQCPDMRGDTHKDNRSMQRLFEKNGFVRCGTIICGNGTPRIAYQKENR